MIAEPCSDSSLVLHSQLVLPISKASIPILVPENYETLWNRVDRICDRHMPSHRSIRVLEQSGGYQRNVNLHRSRDCQEST